jgi:hypothetical protein
MLAQHGMRDEVQAMLHRLRRSMTPLECSAFGATPAPGVFGLLGSAVQRSSL